MKIKLALTWLAFGILLGAGIMQLVDYSEVEAPQARAIFAANASLEAARRTIAEQSRGFTVIEEIDYAPAPVSPASNNTALALGILGAISGRNLSGLTSVLPQPTVQPPQPTGWHGFAIRGHVQPLAGAGVTQAFYSFCVTDKNCTSPAAIPAVTQADLAAAQ